MIHFNIELTLTVAHCLRDEKGDVPVYMLLVSLGRHNLHGWQEPSAIYVDVAEFRIHPDYTGPEKADSDLAIVKLMRIIEYTPKIRPICLWIGETDLENVIGKHGYVAGWGNDGNSKSPAPQFRMSRVPIVSQVI